MSITSVTSSPPRLTAPTEHPPGETCRYGCAFPFQVAPKLAAVLCCLRNEGYPVGDFENGSDVILFDDEIVTGDSIVEGAKAVLERGARSTYAGCVHGTMAEGALSRIEASALSSIAVTDTIPQEQDGACKKVTVCSVADHFANVNSASIHRCYHHPKQTIIFLFVQKRAI